MSSVGELLRSRELVASLVRRELASKYRLTALGHLWSLGNPLAIMAVYTVVFSYIMRVQPEPGDPSGLDSYALWLLCGLLPWAYFVSVVNGGIGTVVGNAALIKKVAFPRSALVVSSSLAMLCTWLIEMTLLVAVLTLAGGAALLWVPLVLVFMVLLWLFATGVALVLSIANVYFRDLQHLVVILLQVWFFLTPVLYPVSLVQAQSQATGPVVGQVTVLDLYHLNPMTGFAVVFRTLLYDNRAPSLAEAATCVAWSAAALVVGTWVFQRYEKGLAEAL